MVEAIRGLFVRKDSSGVGTGPSDARLSLAGLIHRLSTGAPRQGLLSPIQVAGTAGWAYSVPAGWWATSRNLSDGIVVAGSDGTLSIPTDPAPASGSRIDIIYVLHHDVDNADPDSKSIVDVAIGAASGSPGDPTIPAGAMEIARNTMTSAATSTASPGNTITQTATYTAPTGATITVPISAGASPYTALDAVVPSAANGTTVYSSADDATYARRGGTWGKLPAAGDGVWQSYTPTLTSIAGTVTARWCRVGDLVTVQCRIAVTSAPTGFFTVSLPVTADTTVGNSETAIGSAVARTTGARLDGSPVLLSSTTTRFVSTGSGDANSIWGTTVPAGLTSGNSVAFTLTYEAA